MIFYFNANGTIKSFVPEKVYQGSQKINTIYFLSPVPSSSVVVAHFVLQDGSELEPHVLSLVKDFCNEESAFHGLLLPGRFPVLRRSAGQDRGFPAGARGRQGSRDRQL